MRFRGRVLITLLVSQVEASLKGLNSDLSLLTFHLGSTEPEEDACAIGKRQRQQCSRIGVPCEKTQRFFEVALREVGLGQHTPKACLLAYVSRCGIEAA